jgi:hypothetical protein
MVVENFLFFIRLVGVGLEATLVGELRLNKLVILDIGAHSRGLLGRAIKLSIDHESGGPASLVSHRLLAQSRVVVVGELGVLVSVGRVGGKLLAAVADAVDLAELVLFVKHGVINFRIIRGSWL